MPITTDKTAILRHNIFLEKFLTYRVVFQEYFKTMDLIERGEVLKYETYSRLANNFLLNVKIYSHICKSFIEKQNLQGSAMEVKLNGYLADLVQGVDCLDTDQNLLDRSKMKLASARIQQSEREFINTIGSSLA
ncbi:hypothetical protein [Companilactobacillus sp.]|jgi:hypothetical protein|uniref:hypothetical protein n=1 Tax=Companilactobacillus sp. TaxID=2767905 RepID=UPI0025BE7A50|nr:hypothetical protein [Companilactobacillus sp.]MCH4008200.1 hypothetical protein [Companilactobacillus sp.]MCH4051621.1 hypothetical protein [Companilactobacillus sp.]MCH4076143.1 hypothetical protein [Companilactobacillus sp.]MCH4124718.1 hypothetical protein [Companilactobacillus sp.]MCH4131260.1 hypothetical protein [Companilactobacillus sp.]